MPSDNPKHHPEHDPGFDQAKQTTTFGNIDYSRSQQARFYANHIASQVTLFDVRFLLSNVHLEHGTLIADETISVLMSPELALLLAQTAAQAVKNYNDSFGPIRSQGMLTGALATPDLNAPSNPPPPEPAAE